MTGRSKDFRRQASSPGATSRNGSAGISFTSFLINANSSFHGEATVEGIGRSGRRGWSFCDEFQEVKHSVAAAMDRSLSDTAACRIFLGTSEYRSHPFSVIGRSKGVNSKFLGWWLHPFKSRGLYYSPDLNKIIIKDIDYYRRDLSPLCIALSLSCFPRGFLWYLL